MSLLNRALLVVALAVLPQMVLQHVAQAGETPWVRAQDADVRLLAGTLSGGKLEAGLEIRLSPGWKTYWRYPGDSGIPPRFDWTGSRNVRAVAVDFPAPKRFSDGASGFSIGYKGAVVLPLTVELDAPEKATRLDLSLDFAVCEALCVPAHAKISLDVPPGGAQSNAVLTAARALVPAPAPLGGGQAPAIISATVNAAATPPVVEVVTASAGPNVDLFAEGPDEGWALPLPAKQADADGRSRFTFALDGLPSGVSWKGVTLRLTLVDGQRAITTPVPLPAN